jgi:hypothetical protein
MRTKRAGSREAGWMESMHRAAPDVDWHAIEVQNGLRRWSVAIARASAEQRCAADEIGSKNRPAACIVRRSARWSDALRGPAFEESRGTLTGTG